MRILGIETSCDETSAAIIEGNDNTVILKANIVASSLALHAETGGVIPEIAAREQLKYMFPVLKQTLKQAFDTPDTFDTLDTLKKVDAIAVTYGPGLIGSLLVGVETAKTLAFVAKKPLIPVNHMMGHIYANFISHPGVATTTIGSPEEDSIAPARNASQRIAGGSLQNDILFPALALVVSGGHTDLLLLTDHGKYQLIGGTRDDAAGEAFDKIGRLLGLPYPAGPIIEKIAKKGDPKHFRFPRPLIGSDDFDFSFSGLKTAVLREVIELRADKKIPLTPFTKGGVPQDGGFTLDPQTIADLARATQDAIIDVLIKKTFKAAKQFQAKSILLSGGVAANQTLREQFSILNSQLSIKFFAPTKSLCTDNAAMIAAAAFYNYHPVELRDVTADPELYYV